MTRFDFDAEIASTADEPLEFILFQRTWHAQPSMTLGKKRTLLRDMSAAQKQSDPDVALDSFLTLLGSLVIPAECEEFQAEFEEKGDEAVALRVMEALMEAQAGRPTLRPNGSTAPSGRTSRSSTGTARRAG